MQRVSIGESPNQQSEIILADEPTGIGSKLAGKSSICLKTFQRTFGCDGHHNEQLANDYATHYPSLLAKEDTENPYGNKKKPRTGKTDVLVYRSYLSGANSTKKCELFLTAFAASIGIKE